MRSWKLLVLLLAVVLLGTLALTGVATAGPRNSSSFTLVAVVDTTFEPIDRGITFTDNFETMTGDPVDGWEGGKCINLTPDPDATDQWTCEMVVQLPEGTLSGVAVVDFERVAAGGEVTFGVTGGTGAFRSARGEVGVLPYPGDPNRAYIEFRLVGASASY
jgi:hypothetical protein